MDELDKLLSGLSQKKSETRPVTVVSNYAPSMDSTPSKVNDIDFDTLDRLMDEFSSILTQTTPSPTTTSSNMTGQSRIQSQALSQPTKSAQTTVPVASNQNSVKFVVMFKDLKFDQMIGKGNFGAVHKGTYNGRTVAIKELFDTEDTNIEKYYQREIEMLSASRHPNIVEFIGASKSPDGKTYIVTEFCNGKDLKELNKATDMPWKRRIEIALGVAKAVAYLHGKGIIHRDLKSDNVLLTNDGIPKVCDFGFARPAESDKKKQMTMCGTDWTMAPEILLCMDYTKSVDVFSYGMILAEIISRVEADATHFKRVIPGFGVDPEEIRKLANEGAPVELVELCIKCTSDTPSERPSFSDIIQVLGVLLERYNEPEQSVDSIDENLKPESVTILKKNVDAVASPDTAIISEAFQSASNDNVVTENIQGVYVRRKRTKINSAEKFIYAVDNQRPNDVSLTIEITGKNCKILPVGTSKSISSNMVEGVISTGAQTVFATVEPLDVNVDISYTASMSVERSDVEVRCSELEGVFLTTQINFGRITEVTFEAYNKRKDCDVQVEVQAEGEVLEGSTNPISCLVKKKEKKIIGRIFAQENVASSWRWKPVVTYPDEVSNSNGVKLIRRHLGGRTFEFEVENTRDKVVRAEIVFSGEGAATLPENPVVARIGPQRSEVLAVVELKGQTGMNWKWTEMA